ncbi:MAG: SPOR domain-containing protein [Prevotella sp.]|jgi:hypothetical protein|nr:SPOR domain-containing protein [Prevotella sp.]
MYENIFKYLEFALPIHNCVIIPGLGGFILNPESAVLLTDGLIPPKYTVAFNPDLKHDDGILINLYKKDENLSYNVASQKIKDFVRDIKKNIFAGKTINCGNIGQISTDDNNKIIFVANKFFIFPESYGLMPIELSRLVDVERHRAVIGQSSLRYRLGGVAAAAIALFLFTIPSINIKENSSTSYNQQADFVYSLSESFSSMEKKNEKSEEEKTVNKEQTSSRTYYIIVGGEESESMAERLLEKVKKNGFKNAAIVQSDRYRIYVASFTDKTVGNSYLETFRKENPQYKTAWLYSKSN